MDEDATLRALFVKLGYPGLLKFRAAAKKINLEPPLKTLRNIVEGSSQRQVLVQEPEYRGKVVADALNSQWAADLISYVSQPTEDGFTHVLVVQDIFSWKIWTRALKSAQTGENTQAFLEILEEARTGAPDSDQIPFELNTDKGSEFTGKVFQDMLVEKKIKFREKEALNDLSTVDRAIQTLKKTLTKFEISPTLGNWAEELQNATKAHNTNVHTHTCKVGRPKTSQTTKRNNSNCKGWRQGTETTKRR